VLFGLVPNLMLGVLCLPIFAGLAGVLVSVTGTTGGAHTAFSDVLAGPGFAKGVALSLGPGLASAAISLFVTLLLIGCLVQNRLFWWFHSFLSPLLAVPHAAAALGIAFMISPSGWIARMLSPEVTGWQVPPDLQILNDPLGLALTLGLVCKEVPFLVLIALAALPAAQTKRHVTLATTFGYGVFWGFCLTSLPTLYRQLRLPVYAVLSYAMTSVDMAMILGPSLPNTLSVQITNWMVHPSLEFRSIAAAAAIVQLCLVVIALLLWRLIEVAARFAVIKLCATGIRRRGLDRPAQGLAVASGLLIVTLMSSGLLGLGVWSFAGLWPFPAALPDQLSMRNWASSAPQLISTSATTLAIAAISTVVSMLFVLAALDAQSRKPAAQAGFGMGLLYVPLLVPQIVFLPGLQNLTLMLGLEPGLALVIMGHVIFVLPYVFLSLSAPFRAWDTRHKVIAQTLGVSDNAVFWRLRLPMLLGPILTATALGFAVSVGQYLPTLLLGGGRIETLTTEAVALSSGGNRRIIGSVTLLQMLWPMLCFALAILLPKLVFANRRLMIVEVQS
jgi:putative thiamine transport system permease protein